MNVTLKISYRFAILVPPQFNSPIQFQSQINLLADVNNLIVVRSRPRWLKLEISRLYDKILEACCTKERKSPLGLKIFSSTSQRWKPREIPERKEPGGENWKAVRFCYIGNVY